jgi:hypothetical protein
MGVVVEVSRMMERRGMMARGRWGGDMKMGFPKAGSWKEKSVKREPEPGTRAPEPCTRARPAGRRTQKAGRSGPDRFPAKAVRRQGILRFDPISGSHYDFYQVTRILLG